MDSINSGPSADHWFGTDNLGRDILARVLVATRLSLGLALAATAIGLIIGVLLGAAPTVLGRRTGLIIHLRGEHRGCLPRLCSSRCSSRSSSGPAPEAAVIALGLAHSPPVSPVSPQTLCCVGGRSRLRRRRTQGWGIGRFRILTRHVLPNIGRAR